VRGIGNRAVAYNDLRIEQLPRLLGNPFQCHRIPNLPDLPEEVVTGSAETDILFAKSLHEQITAADHFRSINGIGRSGYSQGRATPFTIDERIGKHDVQDVDQEYPFHRGAGVTGTVHDGGKNIEPGSEGEKEEHELYVPGS